MQLAQNHAPPATPWNKARSPFIRYPSQRSPWSTVKPLEVTSRVQAKREFVQWLDKQNPALVAKAQQIAERALNRQGLGAYIEPGRRSMEKVLTLGITPRIYRFDQDMNVRRDAMQLGQATPPIAPTIPEEKAEEGWLDKLIGAASTIAPAYIQFKQQQDILDMQIERAKQGLPPLESAYIAPTVRVEAGMTPEMMTTARRGITEGLQNIAIPAMLIGGVLLLTMGGRRRRR